MRGEKVKRIEEEEEEEERRRGGGVGNSGLWVKGLCCCK